MCFLISYECKKPLIAKKDIPCWKITLKSNCNKSGFLSHVQKFSYIFNKKYKTKMLKDGNIITIGFYSYMQKPRVNDIFCTIRCVIPKGSKYYYHRGIQEYVSNQIIPIKKVRNNP